MRGAFVISLLFAAQAFGALTATITSVNQTQAVLQEQGFTGTCSLLVSTSPNLTPLLPDVDGTEYGNANTDTGRADTLTSADGSTRTVTIGHQTGDRALSVFTTYYFQVSGCGGTVTGSFSTANLSGGVSRTEQSPFDPTKWGNLGLPTIDWTATRSFTDPLTGVTMVPMPPLVGTWRTGCGSGGCSSSSRQFTNWAGGSGWTNPAGVLNGAATNASTNNTNPIDLYADLSAAPDPVAYDWHRELTDIGIVVWGNASSSSVADRVVDFCIFLNPASGCASNTMQVILPAGNTASHVSSGSSDLDGAFPASFPSTPFFGWTDSVSPLIRMENRETFGALTVSGNTLTIPAANLNPQTHFSSALSPGQKIYVAGSSCTNQLCTAAAAPAGPGTLTTVEQPGVAGGNFRAYGWGVRVWKDNANGTATMGVNFKLAGAGSPIGIETYGDRCSFVSVTSGDGKTGYLCTLTSLICCGGVLAFVANDGTTRIISYVGDVYFDDTQGNVFYLGQVNSNGGWTVYKYTYTGDYTTSIDFGYRCSSAGDCPVVNDHVVSVDLMPHSSNADLDQQIEAAQGNTLPPYNSSLYGPWTRANGAVNFEGSSGHFAFFCNLYSGQGQGNSGGPGWCASVDLSQTPARVVRLVHTLDGTGMPHARWASLHSAQAQTADPNNLGYGLDPLNSNSTTTLFGGPFQAQVVSILMGDGVTWNTNTCLDWLPGAGTTCAAQNYLRTCPPNSAPFIECVTVRLPQGGVCNVAATQYEKTAWPCPWNPNASQYPPMQPGDNAVDLAPFGSTDSEHFRVLSMTPDAGNTLRVVLARNATYDYCAYSPWHGLADPLAVDAPTQFVHQNGWKLTMMPGYINGCGAAVFQQEQTTGNYAEVGRSFIIHSAEGRGPTGGLTIVTSQHVMYDTPFTQISTIPPPPLLNIGEPAFHGNASAIGGQLQSYLDLSQFNAGPSGYDWALDMNPLVACGAEQLGCGVARTLTPVSGTVYKIQSIGSVSASAVTYKVQPMIGWAGRYQLNDVSGPSSSVDSTPYSMCFVLTPGECHAGSAANEIYVNVPTAFDPGYCSASLSWVSVPCVLFGDNAPAGAIRQFGIHANDPNSHTSRFVSEGWSSVGRHYPYTHAVAYPDGNWAMMMGTNSMDGFLMTGFMFSLPPWQESSDSDSDFKTLSAKLPAGLKYAEIEFGYSRYIGPGRSPTNGLFCTSRADNCETATASSETQQGAPFAFASEPGTPVSCASGCTISVPVVGPNLVYYRLRRSDDGRRWVTSDIQALAIP